MKLVSLETLTLAQTCAILFVFASNSAHFEGSVLPAHQLTTGQEENVPPFVFHLESGFDCQSYASAVGL